jgi:WD40 repeat protein
VRTWDGATGAEVARHRLGPPGSDEGAAYAAFSADGRYLLVGSTLGRLLVLDARTLAPAREPLQVLTASEGERSPPPLDYFVPSGDGRSAYTGTLVVDYLAGTVQRLPDMGYQVGGVIPSPDGRRLMVDTGDSGVGLWDLAERRWIAPPDAARAGLMGYMTRFSDDGTLFASDSGGRVSYWDGVRGTYLGTVAVEASGDVAFSADDSELILAGGDGVVRTVPLDPNSWLATACRLAGRDLTEKEWHDYVPDRPFASVCGPRAPDDTSASAARARASAAASSASARSSRTRSVAEASRPRRRRRARTLRAARSTGRVGGMPWRRSSAPS